MTDTKNAPLTIELPAFVVDLLAEWARADAQTMRPGTATEKKKAREACAELADQFPRAVLAALRNRSAFSVEGDLADAINERAEAYAQHRAANPDD